MKKIIIVAAVAAMAAGGAVALRTIVSQSDPIFEANVEALTRYEIGVGRICAYDINCWCIYMFPYEEYPGQFVD